MIAYVTIGTNDLDRARTFYDQVFGVMEANALMTDEKRVGYGLNFTEPMIVVGTPFDGETATVGNGSMVALACREPEQVDKVHAAALKAGGTDEGAPGPRGPQFYCGYFRDPDGNKLNAFCLQENPAR